MPILVSINCITYNHEDYIADAIEGFLMQITNFDFEILIGEDCSTDNTRQIVERYVKKHPNKIKLITSEQNVGAKKNSERVFINSKGKYIAECEGDDYWTDPHKLQRQIDYLENHPECSLCFHAAEIIHAPKKPTGTRIKPYNVDRLSPIEDIISGGGGFCPTSSLVYHKKHLESPPKFLKETHVGDYPLQLILSSKGSTYYMEKSMSAYRIGVKDSWSSRLTSDGNYKEKIIKVHMGDIFILESFNEYTYLKHILEIEKAILKKKFEVFLLTKNKVALKSPEYKKYSKSLSLKQKLKTYIRCYFPYFHLNLINMRLVLFRIMHSFKKNKDHINATT